jgi:hypothetical protein
MRVKSFLIMALWVANALLLAILLFNAYDLPRAYAQQRGGSYIAVTAEFQQGVDALWLLKASTGDLAVLVPNQQNGQLVPADGRNIKNDM